ncbi:hypothetical protein NFJ02_26g61890 [Pycnococcus provasolii]
MWCSCNAPTTPSSSPGFRFHGRRSFASWLGKFPKESEKAPEEYAKNKWMHHFPKVYQDKKLNLIPRMGRPPISGLERARRRKALIMSGRGHELLQGGEMDWLYNDNYKSPRFRPEGRPPKGHKPERVQRQRWEAIKTALEGMDDKIAKYREKRHAWKKKVTPLDAVLYDHSPKRLRRLYREKGFQ